MFLLIAFCHQICTKLSPHKKVHVSKFAKLHELSDFALQNIIVQENFALTISKILCKVRKLFNLICRVSMKISLCKLFNFHALKRQSKSTVKFQYLDHLLLRPPFLVPVSSFQCLKFNY